MSFAPKFFTTAESLVDSLDKRLLVLLRDGRKIIGVLRSYDQFANLVLQDSLERVYVGDAYGDLERGVFIIRGENVVLLGEIDEEAEDALPLRQLPFQDILEMQREESEKKARRDKLRFQLLHKQGFSVDFADNDF
ncbi:hypothetical protein H4R18_003527 [Coemansia javaensis]|uniref:U6 snRNA-associated Sm-like protein LSm1 n=1 Tax=Coemansia javaensis TaxID=2761396 RepID=A0A9W8H6Q7_9FUNG|nr:hypothetical protein H4R18_003527 [Coemansia javaensis]